MATLLLFASCHRAPDKTVIREQILQTEKDFEKMAAEKNISEAFYYYADENAVIKRKNDSLIMGKENIRNYYEKQATKDATVTWAPDFIGVSDDGTLGYTYGKYLWKIKNPDGTVTEYKGVFHTVWKRQKDNSWKYVWD